MSYHALDDWWWPYLFILVGGWLVAIPVPFLLMWAPTWGWILLANLLLGVSQGLTWSTTVIMKIDLAGPAKRGAIGAAIRIGRAERAEEIKRSLHALGAGQVASDDADASGIARKRLRRRRTEAGCAAGQVLQRQRIGPRHIARVDEIEQAIFEFQQAPVGAFLDFRFGLRHAKLRHPVQQNLKMSALVHYLCREKNLRVPIRREADHAARRFQRGGLANAIIT